MAVLLVFLSSVIASYWALTDPVRLRAMAQTYLSELVGGPVSVRTASLSLLQGLRLNDVTVRAPGAKGAADAEVFHADAIDIGYDPAALLRGRLVATRIVATGPHVTLVESTDAGGGWNYQRLRPRQQTEGTTRPGDGSMAGVPLPQVVLRDAQVDYAELTGGRRVPRGSMDVEGRFFPSADATRYQFELQSRGAVEGVGPVVAGQVQLTPGVGAGAALPGQVDATLAGFRFGRDVEAMLPREVRDFWQAHQLRGTVDIPEFRYVPGNRRRRATFRLRTRLSHVQLVVLAAELDPPQAGSDQAGSEVRRRAGSDVQPPPPIPVEDVTGEYVFDQDGLRFQGVRGTLMGTALSVTGTMAGYAPTAAVRLRIETPADRPLDLPPVLPYLSSLPSPVREAYDQLKPSGTGRLWVEVDRPAGGAAKVTGELAITDGAFRTVWFPYPVAHATGVVRVRPDPDYGGTRIDLVGLRGHGPAGGPNAERTIRLDGWVGPLTPAVGCGITVAGEGIASEPPLFAAFPPPVREALAVFRGTRGEPTPTFRGDFVCHVDMPVGVGTTAAVTADLNLADGAGRLVPFPYPLDHLAGRLHVREGHVDLDHVTGRRAAATLAADGRVSWRTGPGPADVRPDLTVSARDVPLDAALLAVLPPSTGRVVGAAGLGGLLDVDGRVTATEPSGSAAGPTSARATEPAAEPLGSVAGANAVGPLDYDLTVAFHHGTARPLGGDFAITDLSAALTVRPDRLMIRNAHGRRGAAAVSAAATVELPDGKPAVVHLSAAAHELALDAPLRALLPPPARAAWDALSPQGATDGDLTATIVDDGRTPIDYRVTLRPRDLTVRPDAVPYRLDHVAGTVTVDPVHIDVAGLRGTHGAASVALAGHGLVAHPDWWDLTLSARGVPVDADLRRALSPTLRGVVNRTKLKGTLDVDLTRLCYRGGRAGGADGDLDLVGVARATGASLDVGVPLEQVTGGASFAADIRGGRVAAARGELDLDRVSIADRPVRHLRAHLDQPAGSDTLKLTDVQADLAGGRLAGRVDLRFPAGDGEATTVPTTGPAGGGYAVAFAVTDADVAVIAGSVVPDDKPIHGKLSASFDLQGDWADPATRRGRGDVLVAGRDMYQIPLVLGLLEVTDLSLPTSAPFNRATARYAITGRRVTFEQLQMRGDGLVMSGSGWLDFATKRVRMNFTTDTARGVRVPVLHDLWQGAKQELLQIQVRGTVQDPKVSAGTLHTFTTTVDEVFRGAGDDQDR